MRSRLLLKKGIEMGKDNEDVKAKLIEGKNRFSSAATVMQNVLNALDLIILSLDLQWLGPASQAYNTAHNQFVTDVQTARDVLQKCANALQTMHDKIVEAEDIARKAEENSLIVDLVILGVLFFADAVAAAVTPLLVAADDALAGTLVEITSETRSIPAIDSEVTTVDDMADVETLFQPEDNPATTPDTVSNDSTVQTPNESPEGSTVADPNQPAEGTTVTDPNGSPSGGTLESPNEPAEGTTGAEPNEHPQGSTLESPNKPANTPDASSSDVDKLASPNDEATNVDFLGEEPPPLYDEVNPPPFYEDDVSPPEYSHGADPLEIPGKSAESPVHELPKDIAPQEPITVFPVETKTPVKSETTSSPGEVTTVDTYADGSTTTTTTYLPGEPEETTSVITRNPDGSIDSITTRNPDGSTSITRQTPQGPSHEVIPANRPPADDSTTSPPRSPEHQPSEPLKHSEGPSRPPESDSPPSFRPDSPEYQPTEQGPISKRPRESTEEPTGEQLPGGEGPAPKRPRTGGDSSPSFEPESPAYEPSEPFQPSKDKTSSSQPDEAESPEYQPSEPFKPSQGSSLPSEDGSSPSFKPDSPRPESPEYQPSEPFQPSQGKGKAPSSQPEDDSSPSFRPNSPDPETTTTTITHGRDSETNVTITRNAGNDQVTSVRIDEPYTDSRTTITRGDDGEVKITSEEIPSISKGKEKVIPLKEDVRSLEELNAAFNRSLGQLRRWAREYYAATERNAPLYVRDNYYKKYKSELVTAKFLYNKILQKGGTRAKPPEIP
jgi:uncharacterized protein YukE